MENVTKKVLVAQPQLSKQEFLNLIASYADSFHLSQEAINSIDAKNTRLVYLRGNRFRGVAEGTWTAKSATQIELTVNNEKKNIPAGTSYSGKIPSTDFDLLIINDNDATPDWAKDFCKTGFRTDSLLPLSSDGSSDIIIEGDDSSNPFSAWMKNGNGIVDNFLYPYAVDISQNRVYLEVEVGIITPTMAESMKDSLGKISSYDVEVSSRHSVNDDPISVLIPFYVLEYQFEGNNYYFAMMADKGGRFTASIPPTSNDFEAEQQAVEKEKESKRQNIKLVKLGWVLVFVVLFVFGFTGGLIYLGLWFVGYLIFKSSAEGQIKALDNKITERKEQMKEALRQQLMK